MHLLPFRERSARVPSTTSAGRSWSLYSPAATSSIVRPLSTDSGWVETGFAPRVGLVVAHLDQQPLLAAALLAGARQGIAAPQLAALELDHRVSVGESAPDRHLLAVALGAIDVRLCPAR